MIALASVCSNTLDNREKLASYLYCVYIVLLLSSRLPKSDTLLCGMHSPRINCILVQFCWISIKYIHNALVAMLLIDIIKFIFLCGFE